MSDQQQKTTTPVVPESQPATITTPEAPQPASADSATAAAPTTTTTTTTSDAIAESQPEMTTEEKTAAEPAQIPAAATAAAPSIPATTKALVTETAPALEGKNEEEVAKEGPSKDGVEEEEPKEEAKEEPKEEPKEEAKEEQPAQPEYLVKTPALAQFFDRLPAILSATGHAEMWGVALKDSNDIPTVNVLIKFLRANEGNVKLAEEQLTKALQWRKGMNPVALTEGQYNAEKFGGLGYVTKYTEANGQEVVVTWNIYGSVKNVEATFGDSDEFIRWRVALMELAVKDMKLGEATTVIDYEGEDPYQMLQVHDYLNVSFLRLNPNIRAATKKTIEVFATAYPELLREKFFVNVPAIMGWMFAAMKVFLSKNTTRKFHPISNGANLAREFSALKDQFPHSYGGTGPALQESGYTVKLEQSAPVAAAAPESKSDAEGSKEITTPAEEVPAEAPRQESSTVEAVKADPTVTAQETSAVGVAK
ncbi:CRAL/TRIO domain-containing protein [Aspergillus japonicus CBS 114.51]|uniref:Phosphatidylinositol transfer protein SFH5 n=1 Tax=Aspergillus japonicus CBS 114.51 TaxID=1448312 RepID=A0A8T8XAP7_ASPJA|nr:CRAL/TRIO domain-containing protein [Aspergillus japonicus CBS 114.51]RAH85151.1 CRAL/TRIO domain-containing protein [Aspergillus japonicus CBS 114.51]